MPTIKCIQTSNLVKRSNDLSIMFNLIFFQRRSNTYDEISEKTCSLSIEISQNEEFCFAVKVKGYLEVKYTYKSEIF